MENNEEVVDINTILSDNEKMKEIKKDKVIERIQLSLILILIVVGTLVYFFGYDFFEPLIKVDLL